MDNQLRKWRDEQKHLPEFMRDFHNCKELFKGIYDYIVLEDDHPAKDVSWRQAHCYTIDVFLWFMARHGFTLQRSRARQNFEDLDALLEELNRLRREAFTAAMLSAESAASMQDDSPRMMAPHDFDEARIDRIASSHGDGEHYSEIS